MTDPRVILITGPTGFGKSVLARQFLTKAIRDGATGHVIDIVKNGADFADTGATVASTVKDAVALLTRSLLGPASEDATFIVIDDVSSALSFDHAPASGTPEQNRAVATGNNERVELLELINLCMEMGADREVFLLLVSQRDLTVAETNAGTLDLNVPGFVHLRVTGHGSGEAAGLTQTPQPFEFSL